MAINFPDSPSLGDTYSSGNRTWQWDGVTWNAYGNYPDPTVLKIDPAANRIGINNTSPTEALDVTGNATVSGSISSPTITSIQSDVFTAQSNISTLQSDMTTAQGDITTLESGATATSIKVYADASARSAAVPSPAAGDLSFLTSSASVEVYDGSAWVSVGGASMITKVARFTASGTWTVPTDVTYAIAHIRGGGAGFAHSNSLLGGSGGTSSVAFASGTVSASGGGGTRFYGNNPYWYPQAGKDNSGKGGHAGYDHGQAPHGTEVVAGAAVTPGASITVTVGAGGTAGSAGAAGGSGYVWIEYQEPA